MAFNAENENHVYQVVTVLYSGERDEVLTDGRSLADALAYQRRLLANGGAELINEYRHRKADRRPVTVEVIPYDDSYNHLAMRKVPTRDVFEVVDVVNTFLEIHGALSFGGAPLRYKVMDFEWHPDMGYTLADVEVTEYLASVHEVEGISAHVINDRRHANFRYGGLDRVIPEK